VDTTALGTDAATTVYIATDPTQTTTAIAQSFMTISTAAQPVDHKAVITLTADVWKTAATFAECYLARLISGAPGGTTGPAYTITQTSSPGTRIALQFEYDATANTAYDYAFWYSASNLGNFGQAANISMHVELIKK
jgi:hypothetical protein